MPPAGVVRAVRHRDEPELGDQCLVAQAGDKGEIQIGSERVVVIADRRLARTPNAPPVLASARPFTVGSSSPAATPVPQPSEGQKLQDPLQHWLFLSAATVGESGMSQARR